MIKNFENFINEQLNHKDETIRNILYSTIKTNGTILIIGTEDECKNFIDTTDRVIIDRFDIVSSYNLNLADVYKIKDKNDFKYTFKKAIESERAILFINSEDMDIITGAIINRFNYVINLTK